ncbi:ABC transporter ATP-binding protein [Staphylococcus aureus]|nr:ABC transporter ATP-binding protein [Staphylococcus aureus]
MLKFENVIKSFKDGNRNIEAVKDTNFEINKGDIVALVGPSGSVKVHF